jgi:hypothetical protein
MTATGLHKVCDLYFYLAVFISQEDPYISMKKEMKVMYPKCFQFSWHLQKCKILQREGLKNIVLFKMNPVCIERVSSAVGNIDHLLEDRNVEKQFYARLSDNSEQLGDCMQNL